MLAHLSSNVTSCEGSKDGACLHIIAHLRDLSQIFGQKGCSTRSLSTSQGLRGKPEPLAAPDQAVQGCRLQTAHG